jgi:hypothetical protein
MMRTLEELRLFKWLACNCSTSIVAVFVFAALLLMNSFYHQTHQGPTHFVSNGSGGTMWSSIGWPFSIRTQLDSGFTKNLESRFSILGLLGDVVACGLTVFCAILFWGKFLRFLGRRIWLQRIRVKFSSGIPPACVLIFSVTSLLWLNEGVVGFFGDYTFGWPWEYIFIDVYGAGDFLSVERALQSMFVCVAIITAALLLNRWLRRAPDAVPARSKIHLSTSIILMLFAGLVVALEMNPYAEQYQYGLKYGWPFPCWSEGWMPPHIMYYGTNPKSDQWFFYLHSTLNILIPASALLGVALISESYIRWRTALRV